MTSLTADDDDDSASLVSEAPLSDIELTDAPPPVAPVETLVAGRARRSTAGNLLAQLLAQEADEDDTLFLEDEDDVEFTAKDTADLDDIPLESSSEDEDEGPPPIGGEGDEELEGERALQLAEKQAKRAKKRKADDTFFKRRAAPVKEKRVTIREDKERRRRDSATATEARSSVGAGSPVPEGDGYTALTRPRKKSERISWVPEFVATRASSRTLSLQNRETTMKRLEESEKRRLHTIALMEAAAARKEKKAGPRKEMTQEERLAEARITERRNLKSLNRWERMEEEKLEEQRRKLAALQNRKLAGPVITYWSGRAEWDGTGKLVKLGKKLIEEIEDESGKKKKRPAAPKPEDKEKLEREKAEKEKGQAESSALPADKIKAEDPPDTPTTTTTDALSSLAPPPNPISTSEASSAPDSKSITTPPPLTVPLLSNPPSLTTDISTPEVSNPTLSELESTAPTPALETPLPTSPPNPIPPPPLETATEATEATEAPTTGDAPAPPQDEDKSINPIALTPPSPPHEASTRNLIVLENFEGDDTLRDKTAVMKVLCGPQIRRSGTSLPVPPKPICIITHQPAQFCDPQTGMPYSSLQAYRMLKRVLRGEVRWSPVMGGFVGAGGGAAKGVPEGF